MAHDPHGSYTRSVMKDALIVRTKQVGLKVGGLFVPP